MSLSQTLASGDPREANGVDGGEVRKSSHWSLFFEGRLVISRWIGGRGETGDGAPRFGQGYCEDGVAVNRDGEDCGAS